MAIPGEDCVLLALFVFNRTTGYETQGDKFTLPGGKRSLKIARQQNTMEIFTYKLVNRGLGIMVVNIGCQANQSKLIAESDCKLLLKASISPHECVCKAVGLILQQIHQHTNFK